MSRDYTYHTYLPDGNTVDISDEPAGYDRFIEIYCYYGDLKVEIRPFQFGKGIDEQPTLKTMKLSELIDEDDLESIKDLKSKKKELDNVDNYILDNLYDDWVPPTPYEELENKHFQQPELKKSMAKLRKLGFVEYHRGRGYSLTRAGVLIQQ